MVGPLLAVSLHPGRTNAREYPAADEFDRVGVGQSLLLESLPARVVAYSKPFRRAAELTAKGGPTQLSDKHLRYSRRFIVDRTVRTHLRRRLSN